MFQPSLFSAHLVATLLLAGSVAAQAPTLAWQRCYGGPLDELAHAVALAPDGSRFAAGISFGNGGDVSGHHTGLDGWAFKTDAGGEMQWQLCLGTAYHELMSGILPLPDGGCMAVGLGVSYPGGNNECGGSFAFEDFWLMRLTDSGGIAWQQCFGGSNQEIPNDLAAALDGGFFLAGFARSDDGDVAGQHGGKDAWVLKTDAEGSLLWATTLGGSADEDAFDVEPSPDGGCIVAAATKSDDGDVTGQQGGKNAWVLKLSADGDLEWQKTFGGSADEEARAILPLPDGGYLLACHTDSNEGDVSGNHGGSDVWMLRLDAEGGLLWQKCFGGASADFAADLLALPDGSFTVTGESASEDGDLTSNYGAYDCWLFGMDAEGGLLWQKSFGGSDYDYPSALQLLPNGELLLAAETKSNDHDVSGNHGAYDIWLAGLSTQANAVKETRVGFSARAFPNPADGELRMEYELPKASEVRVLLLDFSGKEVALLLEGERATGISKEAFALPEGLAGGAYCLKIIAANGVALLPLFLAR